MSPRSAIEACLLGNQKKIHDFASWAFGDDYREMDNMDLLNNWNKLHGSQYTLSETEEVWPSCKKMVELWEMEVEPDEIRE